MHVLIPPKAPPNKSPPPPQSSSNYKILSFWIKNPKTTTTQTDQDITEMKCLRKPKVIFVPYPAQGHVTPILQLAYALCDHGFESIIILPEFIHRRMVSKTHDQNKVMFMSIPDGLDDKNEPHDFFSISYAMENNMPVHLETIIHCLMEEGRLVFSIIDLLASWAIQVLNRCRVPVAGFWPAMLATYKLIVAIPEMILHGHISEFGIPQHQGNMCSLQDQPMLMNTQHLPWLIGNSASQKARFMFWLRTLDRSRHLQWLLVNSFPSEDHQTFDHHYHSHQQQQQQPNLDGLIERLLPNIIQIGPLNGHTRITKNPSFWEEDQSCLEWLNTQKHNSVIYVSFGSWVGPIGEEKIAELALGLEITRRPFIWVLGSTWRNGLPDGYSERVGKMGKVVSWAPQKEVLGHSAVGCYLTHCGWNSTMEAIQCGKRLLCYPVAGDQFVNCTYIVDVWRIGIKLSEIRRNEVEEGVKKVMVMEEGEEMQQRVMKLKVRLTGEEGCSKAKGNLTSFIHQISMSVR